MRSIYSFLLPICFFVSATVSFADKALANSSELVQVDLLVGAKSGFDAPEEFTLWLPAGSEVEAPRSVVVLGPAAFLEQPFQPTKADQKFLDKIMGDPKALFEEKTLRRYEELALRLFLRAFNPPVKTTVRSSKLGGGIRINHAFKIEELIAFQTWYFEVAAPQMNDLMAVTTKGDDNSRPILPFLIFGTVHRTGDAPNYKIEFEPTDTIITANAQNEAYDTTLDQLRTGIYDVPRMKKANIGVERILSVGCQGNLK